MKSLTEVKREIDELAQKAKSNYEKFGLLVPVISKDNNVTYQKHLEKGKIYIKELEMYQRVDIQAYNDLRELHEKLKKIIDPADQHATEDIKELIEQIGENEEKKEEAVLFYNALLKTKLSIENNINRATQYLGNNFRLKDSADTIIDQTEQYSTLKNTILKTELITAPKEIKNASLMLAYSSMKKAHGDMRALILNDKALSDVGSHEKAITLLKEAHGQYIKFQEKYNTLLSEYNTANNLLENDSIKFEKLRTTLSNLLDKFPKAEPSTIDARSYQNKLKNKKFDTDIDKEISYVDRIPLIHSKIMQENMKIEAMIKALENKYQQDLIKPKTLIEEKAKSISQKLIILSELMKSCSTYLNDKFTKEFDEKYELIQRKNVQILNEAIGETTPLISTLHLFDEAKKLDDTTSIWAKQIQEKIQQALSKHYKDLSIQMKDLQSNIQKEIHSEDHLSIEVSSRGTQTKDMEISTLVSLIKETEKAISKMDEVHKKYQKTQTLVESICAGFKSGKASQSLKENLLLNTTPEDVSNLLETVVKQSRAEVVNWALVNVEFSQLNKPVIEGIRHFMTMGKVPPSPDAQSILEKLKCYDELQFLNKTSIAMQPFDKAIFRQAFLFLKEQSIPTAEAYELAVIEKNVSVILAIKAHPEAISKEDIKSILSSDIKKEAIGILLGKKWKDTTPLIQELASNEQFAKAVINLKDNKELFTQEELLFLINVDGDVKKLFIQALSSENSHDYQTIFTHLLESDANHDLVSYINNEDHRISIKPLTKIFTKIDIMFTDLSNSLSKSEKSVVKNKLLETKEQIFNHFIKAETLEKGFEQSIKTINDNFKDNRKFLKKVADGFTNIFKNISHWWNKTNKNPNLNKNEITAKFKKTMSDIVANDCPTPAGNEYTPRSK